MPCVIMKDWLWGEPNASTGMPAFRRFSASAGRSGRGTDASDDVAMDLQYSHVEPRVEKNGSRRHLATVGKLHGDVARVAYDVVVGRDQPVIAHDEASVSSVAV
jgi:hypothetical protein